MVPAKKGGLGRGLDALFRENSEQETSAVEVRITEIEPNKTQPRKEFDPEALRELSESIAAHGVLQPLLVRPLPEGTGYQIIAGERRWRASRQAGLATVPVVVKELDDREAMEIALVENLQREDLNAVEEAEGYRSLIELFGVTQEQAAERVGKSRSAVANALRLLALPEPMLAGLRAGSLTAGHARALLAIGDNAKREQAYKQALAGATVRELEKVARQRKGVAQSKGKRAPESFYQEVELALSAALGRRVSVEASGNKGTLKIEFYSREELADMANRLAGRD